MQAASATLPAPAGGALATRRLQIGYVMQADAVDMSLPSGVQMHVEAIYRGLALRGHRMRMVAIQQGETQWSDDLARWSAARADVDEATAFRLVERVVRGVQSRVHAPFIRFFDSYRFADACQRPFRGFDVLYERDGTICYGGIIAARRLGIPIVLEVNGDLVEEWRQMGLPMSGAQRATVHWMTGRIYRAASHIIAVGETLRETIVRRFALPPSHVSVVRNGASVDRFLDLRPDRGVRERFGIPPGRIVIFTGSFQAWHGVDLILQAFGEVAAARPDVTMVFVGDGQMSEELRRSAASMNLTDRVVLTGRVNHADVAQLLWLADVAVIYHRAVAAQIVETPLKLFEYMASGKAIVAPAVPHMQRIVSHRESGVLVPPDRPDLLAAAVIELLADDALREALGEAARREAVEKHSWGRAVREVEAVLFEVVERHRRRRQAPHSGSERAGERIA